VVEQTVQHVWRLAGGGGDHLRVEWAVLVRHMGVERDARLVAMTGVHVGRRFAATAGEEVLPVRARLGAITPHPGERQRAMRVDQAAERLGVAALRNVPVMDQRELA
jgi:hypothetical protein